MPYRLFLAIRCRVVAGIDQQDGEQNGIPVYDSLDKLDGKGISCGAMAISHANHVYWFPLNAFLLLQPSFEDSEHRLVTRPIGTALGCLVVALVEPFLPTVPMQFAFAFLMMFFMYCSTPGTWGQPIFSTSFALILASMSMQDNTLIWLRIAYVITAVLLVSVASVIGLPTTM